MEDNNKAAINDDKTVNILLTLIISYEVFSSAASSTVYDPLFKNKTKKTKRRFSTIATLIRSPHFSLP